MVRGEALLPQFGESRIDPRKHRRLSELAHDPVRLGQMLDCESAVLLNPVKKAAESFVRGL